MAAEAKGEANAPRRRGRPRIDIHPDAVADAVAELFGDGGIEAVSIADTARKMSVSRATLYRTVPTKGHLLGLLFERSTAELTGQAQALINEISDPGDQLVELVRLQVDAAIRMRRYMPVFFGGGDLPPDVLKRWRNWSRDYESIWVDVVSRNMAAGKLAEANPVVVARLLLGSSIWVSRWFRPSEDYTAEEIIATAVSLVTAIQD